MSEMGLSEYCHDINQMNADTLIAQFQSLVGTSTKLRPEIAQRVGKPDSPWTSSTSSSSETKSTSRYSTKRLSRRDEPRLPSAARRRGDRGEARFDEGSRWRYSK